MSRTVMSTQGQVVDQIALAAYGVTAGATEAVLAANPGLPARGCVLPEGLTIILPDIEAPAPATDLLLWD
jgi:phage tail protein X